MAFEYLVDGLGGVTVLHAVGLHVRKCPHYSDCGVVVAGIGPSLAPHVLIESVDDAGFGER